MESKGELIINSLAKKYRVPVLLDADAEEEKKWLATGILFPPLDLQQILTGMMISSYYLSTSPAG